MVPRLSAPAITSARLTPGIGRSTIVVPADSHFPAIPLTSSFFALTSASIRGLFPIVPTSTTSSPFAAPTSFDTSAACAVTRPTSALKSPTARTTPGQSASLTTNGAAFPLVYRTNPPCTGVVLTYLFSPSAHARPAHSNTAIPTKTVDRICSPATHPLSMRGHLTPSGYFVSRKKYRYAPESPTLIARPGVQTAFCPTP